MPHLVLDVHDDGTLTATLDTRPVDPPAAKRPAPEPVAEEKSEPRRAVKRQRGADPISVDGGDGFIAGEDVAVALIAAHTDATPDGRARALLDPAVVAAARAGEVVLVGRVSGTIAVRSLS